MQFKKAALFIVFLLIVVFIWGCSRKDPNVLAKMGDWTLTVDDFRDIAVRRWGGEENAARKNRKELENLLDEVIVNHLKVVDGYDKGLDKDPEVQKEYEKALDRAAISKLYRDEILDKVITEEEVRNFYDHDKEEIKASHIMLAVKPGEDDKDQKKKIERIYNEAIQPGADFKKLAEKYTEDKSTPDGDLGWFQWGVMVGPFQEAAFALQPGEISKPVKTQYGWHIIKLEGRREREGLEPYEEAKERIRGQIQRQKREELSKAAEDYINNLKDERKFAFEEDNINAVIKALDSKVKTQDPLSLLTEEQQALPLATLDDGAVTITVRDVIERAKELGPSSRAFQSAEMLKDYTDRLIVEKYLLPDQARKLGCYDDPEVQKAANEARDRKIRQLIQTKEITDKAEPTEEEAQKYFEENAGKYMSEAQYTLLEILVSDEQKANELAERIRNGENMRDLAITYSERRKAREKKGVLGPIRKSQYGEIGKEAAKAELGVLVGPIYLKSSKKWSLFKVISKEDPKPQEFEKIKNKVMSDLRLEKRRELEKTWTAELKKSMKYSVNKAPLKTIFADVVLTKEETSPKDEQQK